MSASPEHRRLAAGGAMSSVGHTPRPAAERLAQWLEARRFSGPDPYSGLAAPRATIFAGSAISSRGVKKRYPRLARAMFGPADVAMAKTVALVLSACAILDHGPTPRVARLRTDLLDRRTPEGGFAYEFGTPGQWPLQSVE